MGAGDRSGGRRLRRTRPMATKTVLISGTSTGIGAACAARMAAAGWKVYGGVRNKVDGDTLTEQVSGDVIPVQLDVTSNDEGRQPRLAEGVLLGLRGEHLPLTALCSAIVVSLALELQGDPNHHLIEDHSGMTLLVS
jgi:short-subunit dehydrogenase